jgi:hypothetical protein
VAVAAMAAALAVGPPSQGSPANASEEAVALTVRPPAATTPVTSPTTRAAAPSPSAVGASPTPLVVVPSSSPDHGPWAAALVVGGFLGAGALTLLLARRASRRPGPES